MEKQKDIKNLSKIINNSNIKGLIFDFDGVITHLPVDYDSLRKELSKYFLSKYNFENNFNPLNPSLELMKKKLGKKALYRAYEIIEKYETKSLSKARPKREIINFIKNNSSHKKIAIFSMNMHKTVKSFLIKNKLLKYINLIVAKDNVNQYKPNPEGLYQILNKFHLNKTEAVFIGDKEIDFKTGKSAGIKSVIVSNI